MAFAFIIFLFVAFLSAASADSTLDQRVADILRGQKEGTSQIKSLLNDSQYELKSDILGLKSQMEKTTLGLRKELDETKQLILNLTQEVQRIAIELAKQGTGEKSLPVVTLSNGKKYHFSKERKTWSAARDYCAKHGMQLASPKTQQQLTLLHQQAGNEISWNYWLSASDVGRRGVEFRWLDGEVLPVNSTLWRKNIQPDNFGKTHHEVCVFINEDLADSLFDTLCLNSNLFICEVV